MGEGWGDFFAICMTSQATDDFAKRRIRGRRLDRPDADLQGELLLLDPALSLFGRHGQEPADVQAHQPRTRAAGRPAAQSDAGGPNNEVHNAGEVWCCALWEVFVDLVAAHGHARPSSACCKYVIGGLKLTPSRPTFVQARDAIISAASALQPADVPLIWNGFAKRGMGKNAKAPPSSSSSLTEVVENFDP